MSIRCGLCALADDTTQGWSLAGGSLYHIGVSPTNTVPPPSQGLALLCPVSPPYSRHLARKAGSLCRRKKDVHACFEVPRSARINAFFDACVKFSPYKSYRESRAVCGSLIDCYGEHEQCDHTACVISSLFEHKKSRKSEGHYYYKH